MFALIIANTDAIGQALNMDPTKPVYDDRAEAKEYGGFWQWPATADFGDSEWTHTSNGLAVGNPVATLLQQENIGKSRSLQGNLELDYKVHGFEDLRLHVNGGMEVAHGHSDKLVCPPTMAICTMAARGGMRLTSITSRSICMHSTLRTLLRHII